MADQREMKKYNKRVRRQEGLICDIHKGFSNGESGEKLFNTLISNKNLEFSKNLPI